MLDPVPDGEEVYVHPERTEPMLLEEYLASAMVSVEVAAGEEALEEVLAGDGNGQDGIFLSMRRHIWKMRLPSWREK